MTLPLPCMTGDSGFVLTFVPESELFVFQCIWKLQFIAFTLSCNIGENSNVSFKLKCQTCRVLVLFKIFYCNNWFPQKSENVATLTVKTIIILSTENYINTNSKTTSKAKHIIWYLFDFLNACLLLFTLVFAVVQQASRIFTGNYCPPSTGATVTPQTFIRAE